jgi:Domain of unknown function (DUF4349)
MGAEPRLRYRRPIGMTALAPLSTISRRPAAWAGVLAAGVCLLAAGCSAGSPSAASAAGTASGGSVAQHAAMGARAAPEAPVAGGAARSNAAQGSQAQKGLLRLSALGPLSPSIIYTAGLTVRAPNVETAVSRATSITESAGGYVSAEHTSLSRNRSVRTMVDIQFKIPVSSYPATLAALGVLGTKQSETQRALDVTQTVADVSSRVTSAKSTIVQLRKLLARAGTVNGLLSVQNQISQEEASLEALQSQQRALASQTTYATVSMVILGPAPVHRHHHSKAAAGFLSGLIAGWHALGKVTVRVLTVAGAVLPFVLILALVAAAAYAARRRLARRRTRTSPAQ